MRRPRPAAGAAALVRRAARRRAGAAVAAIVPLTFSEPATEIWTAPPPAPAAVLQSPARPPAHPAMSGVCAELPRATPALPPALLLPWSAGLLPPLPPAVPEAATAAAAHPPAEGASSHPSRCRPRWSRSSCCRRGPAWSHSRLHRRCPQSWRCRTRQCAARPRAGQLDGRPRRERPGCAPGLRRCRGRRSASAPPPECRLVLATPVAECERSAVEGRYAAIE